MCPIRYLFTPASSETYEAEVSCPKTQMSKHCSNVESGGKIIYLKDLPQATHTAGTSHSQIVKRHAMLKRHAPTFIPRLPMCPRGANIGERQIIQ